MKWLDPHNAWGRLVICQGKIELGGSSGVDAFRVVDCSVLCRQDTPWHTSVRNTRLLQSGRKATSIVSYLKPMSTCGHGSCQSLNTCWVLSGRRWLEIECQVRNPKEADSSVPELTKGMPQSWEICCQMVDITPVEGQDGNSNSHLLAISFELLSEGWLLRVFPLSMLVFFGDPWRQNQWIFGM